MKTFLFDISRWILTALCKVNAFLASKAKNTLTFEMLKKSLEARDKILCKEAKYCMNKVMKWQSRAKLCVLAHHEYEREMKPKKSK